jgi:hypothetical protein
MGGIGRIGGGLLGAVGNIGLGIFGAEQIANIGKSAFAPSIELARLKNQMRMTGFTDKQIEEAEKKAGDVRRQFPGVSKLESMRGMIETKAVFANAGDAIKHADRIAEANLVMRAASEKAPSLSKDPQQHAMSIVKTAEMLGAVSKREDFQKVLDAVMKANILSGGRVSPEMIQQQVATEGPGRYLMSLNSNLLLLTHLTQEMATGTGGGRGRAGSAMATTIQSLIGGTMNKGFAKSLSNLGLLPTMTGKSGDLNLPVMTKQILGADLFAKDPMAWAAKYFIPSLEKKYPGFTKMNQQDQAMAFNQAISGAPKLAKTVLSEITLSNPRANILRQQAQRESLPGAATSVKQAELDPTNRLRTVNTAWENLLLTMGKNQEAINLGSGTLRQTTRVIDAAARIMGQFNAVTHRLAGSSNSLHKAFAMIGKDIEMLIKTLYGAVKWVINSPNMIGGGIGNAIAGATQIGQSVFNGGQGRLATHSAVGRKDWAADFRATMPPPGDVHIHNHFEVDGKTLHKESAKYTINELRKSGLKSNQSSSLPGGSYAPSSLNHGGSGHQ